VNRPWLKSYPPSVEASIDDCELRPLNVMLRESCAEYRHRMAFSNMGASLTFTRLEHLSACFAAWLQNQPGLKRGDRVAIMMPNLLQYPVVMYGAIRAGMTVVNVNPLYTKRELEHQLNDAGVRVIVILENFVATLQAVIDQTSVDTVVVTRVGDLLNFPRSLLTNVVLKYVKKKIPAWRINDALDFSRIMKGAEQLPYQELELGLDDIAFLQYTGGTTGLAKGAVLTHGNMAANLQQVTYWLSPFVGRGGEVMITALPLYHIFSLTANCLTFTALGGENVLITNPRDFPAFVKGLRGLKFTVITGVNTLFAALLRTPGFESLDFSGLKLALGGGMAVQSSVAEQWKAVTGSPLLEAYGLTETSPAACMNPLSNQDYNGSIGLPIPSTDVLIMDDENQPLGYNETGEICIRGPQVMKEYWQRPEETACHFSPPGWFRSGDMGYMDEHGYVFLQDRKKDMILVSGFNVYPNEIENILVEHPGIIEAAAVGISHGHSGEVVKVFVVRHDETLTEVDVIEHCRQHMAAYKIPREVEFRQELPKTNVGKVLRRSLRA
jgi:long-chain acyl-CoA synthetase